MLGDNLAGDLVGLELAVVLAVGVAVPLFVSLEGELLILLVEGKVVRTVAAGGFKSRAVAGGDHGNVCRISSNLCTLSVEVLLAGFVKILLYEPSGGKVVGHVEVGFFNRLCGNDNDGVVVNLNETNLFPCGYGHLRIVHHVSCTVVSGFAPSINSGDYAGEKSNRCFVCNNEAVFVSESCEGVECFNAEVSVAVVVNVEGERVAAEPSKSGIERNVNRSAVGRGVGAVSCLYELGNLVGVVIAVVYLRLDLLAGVEEVLCVNYFEVACVVGVCTAVVHEGVELLLHRVDIVVSGDLGAVVPASVLVQSDLPSLAGFAFSNAELANVVSGNVLGKLFSHFGNDVVTVESFVGNEVVEAHREPAENVRVIGGLPCVGVPVETGGTANVIIVGVLTLVSVVLGRFNSAAVTGGRSSSVVAISLLAAGYESQHCRQHHSHNKKKRNQFLHNNVLHL